MQKDQDLFNLMKESYPLNPREEFINSTKNILNQRARKIQRKRKWRQFSILSSSIIVVLFTLSWLFLFNGLYVSTKSLGELMQPSIVVEREPLVYIYHTHDTESFASELEKPSLMGVHNEKKYITLVGERLTRELIERNIDVLHDQTKTLEIVEDRRMSFSDAYTISRKPLEVALDQYKSIEMVFDIHRDSQARKQTTISIDGKDYAKIIFIASSLNQHYQKNVEFAELLHNKIEESYPGLSRGVIVKSSLETENTYNQDLFNKAIILEVGGVENSLEEEYRTVEILADVIQELTS
ncbi:stage II sporulation protein P [Bacillus sp. 2205SS5-2]|uniref:stage II sporulation protein P n=1 Tax=Bacillus sp. 2205SS5-2 TaxID=3109031 RepID=UPI003006E62D